MDKTEAYNEVSNEDLARMIANGFERIDDRLDKHDSSFEKVDSNILDIKLTQKDERRTLNMICASLGIRDQEIDELQKNVVGLDKRVSKLEKSR